MEEKRLSIELPAVPQSVRAFIEKAVKDERTFKCFVESPAATLLSEGISIDVKMISRDDYENLLNVLVKLKKLVGTGKLPQDFRFEEIFKGLSNVAYESRSESSDTVCEKNFDHSTEGHDCYEKSKTEQGVKTHFNVAHIQRSRDFLTAPLLSPGDLAKISASIHNELGKENI